MITRKIWKQNKVLIFYAATLAGKSSKSVVQIAVVTDSLASAYRLQSTAGGLLAAVIVAALKLQPNDIIVLRAAL
ncbi:hypothetical protein DXT99_01830 [Pontibacter diazotrophicus]|uniref:Uncharacterized protein n=1 Tax=Pontibacter diazotrophicus TaxID=1400979 RepID=A0A3D8LHM0_9BACT|nr:hypothetical protein [Pontibacter diazotrophicus]RDV16877.1 hypothetical protein DXT99_01830 [Pontibacter diazotrophicus]